MLELQNCKKPMEPETTWPGTKLKKHPEQRRSRKKGAAWSFRECWEPEFVVVNGRLFFFFLFMGASNPGSQKYQSSQRRKAQDGMHHAYLGRPCTRANQIMWDSYPLNPPAISPCPERCGTAGEPGFTYTRWVPWKPCLTPKGLGSGWDTSANRRHKRCNTIAHRDTRQHGQPAHVPLAMPSP